MSDTAEMPAPMPEMYEVFDVVDDNQVMDAAVRTTEQRFKQAGCRTIYSSEEGGRLAMEGWMQDSVPANAIHVDPLTGAWRLPAKSP
jgi:hypothetical protein